VGVMTLVVATVSGHKGGTGKTVVASLLSYHLSTRIGEKVLVIDLGEAGSSTTLLLEEDPGPPYISDFFLGRATWSDVIVVSNLSDNLMIVPCSGEVGPVDPTSLEYLIDRTSKHFEYIILDLPAYPGSLYDPVVGLAEVIITVFNPDFLSFQAVSTWLKRRDFFRRKLILPLLNKYFLFMGDWKDLARDEFGTVFTMPFDAALQFSFARNIGEAYKNASNRVKKDLEVLTYRLQKPLLKVTG